MLLTTFLVGCGGKKTEVTNADTKPQVNTQVQTEVAKTPDIKPDTTKTSTEKTADVSKYTASTQPTPTIDQMIKEEKSLGKFREITKAYKERHPTFTLDAYLREKYDLVKNANNLDVFTIISDSVIVYHVTFMELANTDNMWLRDVKVEFRTGKWNVMSDEIGKLAKNK